MSVGSRPNTGVLFPPFTWLQERNVFLHSIARPNHRGGRVHYLACGTNKRIHQFVLHSRGSTLRVHQLVVILFDFVQDGGIRVSQVSETLAKRYVTRREQLSNRLL